MTKRLGKILIVAVAIMQLLVSCHWAERETPKSRKDTNTFPDYLEQPKQKVMIFISAGFNGLSNYLKEDIQDMMKGYLPAKNGTEALFIIAKHIDRDSKTPVSPCLIRLYRNVSGVSVADTLYTLEKGTILAKAETVNHFLTYIKDNFPCDHYGLVLSSHGNGWLPKGYYDNPASYEGKKKAARLIGGASFHEFEEPERLLTKTILQETYYEESKQYSTEVEISDFADAIPMHLDYMLIDACLMGCVEVAYAFKDIADVIGFSQAEVLADGFDYEKLASCLLELPEPSPLMVCSDYISRYEAKSNSERSATISLVDARKLPRLASVCKDLFRDYRTQIDALDWATVQNFGGNKHWYFDLEDIFVKAGVEGQDLEKLSSALSECIIFKGETGQYYSVTNGVNEISAFSGLTMYLRQSGTQFLADKYSSLAWNLATNYISTNTTQQ